MSRPDYEISQLLQPWGRTADAFRVACRGCGATEDAMHTVEVSTDRGTWCCEAWCEACAEDLADAWATWLARLEHARGTTDAR